MSYAAPLWYFGAYLVRQVEAANLIGHAEGILVTVGCMDVSMVFATEDGGAAPPPIVVGGVSITNASELERLPALSLRVFVDKTSIHRAPPAAVGRLLMRVLV